VKEQQIKKLCYETLSHFFSGIITFSVMPEMDPGPGPPSDFNSEPIKTPTSELNLDPTTWNGWLNSLVLWTAQNPWQFVSNVLLALSPLFLLSLILSWKLSKAIEAEKREKKLKAKRVNNVNRSRKVKDASHQQWKQ